MFYIKLTIEATNNKLIPNSDINIQKAHLRCGRMCWHYAACHNKTDILEVLLTKDPNNIDATDNFNQTPAYYAAQASDKYQEPYNFLLRNSAKVKYKITIKNKEGWPSRPYSPAEVYDKYIPSVD